MPSNASEPAPRPGLAAPLLQYLIMKCCSTEAALFRYQVRLLCGLRFRGKALVRLEGFLGQIGVELTQLGRVCDITFAAAFTYSLCIQALYPATSHRVDSPSSWCRVRMNAE